MADDKGLVGGFNFGRINQLGATLRQSAQEISAKAAAQVNDITKLAQQKIESSDTIGTGSIIENAGGASMEGDNQLGASSPASVNNVRSEAVEKKELVEMMKKMNQKMKLLANIRQQLSEKLEKVEKEKQELRNLVVDEILNGGVNIQGDQDEIGQIRAAWRQVDEQNSMALQQLQNEFKKLHTENQTNGTSNGDKNSWEIEKQSLTQQHEQELIQIKEELNKKVEELNSLQSLSRNSKNEVDQAAEIQKVREEAAEQLQAFRQKVVTARNAELTKLKAEMKEQAQQMLEAKSNELKQQYETEMVNLKQQVAAASQTAVAAASHANEIANLRSEMEKSKMQEIAAACDATEKKVTSELERKLSGLSKKHQDEMEKFRMEADEKLNLASTTATAQVQSITQQARDTVTALQKELASNKESHEIQIKSLQEQIEATKIAAKREMEQKLDEVRISTATTASQSNDETLQKLREELLNSSKIECENLQKQFNQEKESMRVDFQQRYHASIQKIQSDANALKDEAINKVREEMAGKLAEAKKQLETQKEEELKLALSTADATRIAFVKETEANTASKLEKIKEEFNNQLNIVQQQLEQKSKELSVKSNEEQSLQSQVQELQSRLASVQEGNDKNSTQLMDDALTKQRTMYEERMEAQKVQHNEQIQLIQTRLEEALKSKEEIQIDVSTLRTDLKTVTEERDLKIRAFEHSMVKLKKELLDQIETITKEKDQANQQLVETSRKLDELQLQLSQKEALLSQSSTNASEYASKIESLEKQHASAIQQKMDESARICNELNASLADLSKRLEVKEAEFQQLSNLTNATNEAYRTLQINFNELQCTYDSEMKKLQSELESSRNLIVQEQGKYEKMISDLKESFIANASSTDKELADARQKLIDEKDAEIASIKAAYEAKLQESAAKEVTVAQSFNKVKAAYAQKLKTLETENAEKINSYESEKTELIKAADSARDNIKSLEEKHEKEVLDLQESLSKKIKELNDANVSGLQEWKDKVNASEATIKANEATIAQLETDLKLAREEALSVKDSSSGDAIQKELNEKLESIKDEHNSAIAKLQSEYETKLNALKAENDSLKAKAEFVDTLEKQKEELIGKLESQSRKNEEDTNKLRKAMETHVDKMTAQFKEKLENARKSSENEMNALQKLNQEREQKVTALVDKLKALTATSTKVRDENEALKSRIEAEMKTQNELRSKIESMKKQYDESNSNNAATASSLLQEQEKLTTEKIQLNNQIKTLQGTIQSQGNKIEELSGKLGALTSNLNALTDERKDLEEKLERALKLEPKLKASEAEATDLRDQINKLKLERQKNITLVERLQSEKETNERNHGQRTALVGMLETQIAQLNDKNSEINAKFEAALYDLSQKDEMIQSNEEKIRKLETELQEAQTSYKKISEALNAAQKNAESKSSKVVESLQRELQATKQQMVRKSSAAQKLIQQREAECAELRATNRALQQEVDKGSYSERRIFELAAQQSNRESLQVSEIEARDSIIERLKHALIERDDDLANAEKHTREVEHQIEELFRIRRREDVNIDYLKSIVVKYLSLPPGSDERARLLPVLATLLQFDEYDYKVIEEGRNKVSWWGSSVIPTLINAPTPPPTATATPTGSAEISLRTQTSTTGGSIDGSGSNSKKQQPARTTSLQF